MGNQRSTSRTNGKICTHLELCLESTPCKLQVMCLTWNVKRECKYHCVVTETAGFRRMLCILLQSDSPLAKLLMCNVCVCVCVSVSSWLRNWSWVCSLLRQNLVLCLWNYEYTQWQSQDLRRDAVDTADCVPSQLQRVSQKLYVPD